MENRYILGDLVRENIGNSIVKIINTSRYGYNFINLSNDVNGILVEESIKGIPLTPEILEKSGWRVFIERHDFKYAFVIGDSFCLVIETGCLDGMRVHIKSGNEYSNKLRALKYVHQLQHLLFGLGLNSEMEV